VEREQPVAERTGDGSETLFLPHLNEHYHSVKGALTEALHVYVESAFHRCPLSAVSVLEVGFGTGLNTWLTLLDARRNRRRVEYTALEKYPLPADLAIGLGYAGLFPDEPDAADLFDRIQRVPWNEWCEVAPGFRLLKRETDATEITLSPQYDVVYYDAFAPEKQPELWSEEQLARICAGLRRGGILTTYCAKGEVRRSLQRCGLSMERLPGPPGGKREILRGILAEREKEFK
jgi:Uncharacterized conserved protein